MPRMALLLTCSYCGYPFLYSGLLISNRPDASLSFAGPITGSLIQANILFQIFPLRKDGLDHGSQGTDRVWRGIILSCVRIETQTTCIVSAWVNVFRAADRAPLISDKFASVETHPPPGRVHERHAPHYRIPRTMHTFYP